MYDLNKIEEINIYYLQHNNSEGVTEGVTEAKQRPFLTLIFRLASLRCWLCVDGLNTRSLLMKSSLSKSSLSISSLSISLLKPLFAYLYIFINYILKYIIEVIIKALLKIYKDVRYKI